MVVILIVVGGFFLIAIIGIIAAIAIPNLLTAKNRAMQKRTMADMRSLATACEAYATDNNHYPEAVNVAALAPLLTPTYIREVPSKDAWTHDLRYQTWSRERDLDSYGIASGGKDGAFEHETVQEYTPGATSNFDCDLVYANGSFVQYPEGTQR
jgi:general secretion pathway protein G